MNTALKPKSECCTSSQHVT